jgi:K+-sensing histidine kinase KdpD
LQQVFKYISNAVNYNDKPIGKVRIYYDSTRFSSIFCKDNGPGIPKQYRKKRVFQVFSTIEAKDKRGTGIGLSIVQKIIEEKGQCQNESEENKGTILFLRYKIADSSLKTHLKKRRKGELSWTIR